MRSFWNAFLKIHSVAILKNELKKEARMYVERCIQQLLQKFRREIILAWTWVVVAAEVKKVHGSFKMKNILLTWHIVGFNNICWKTDWLVLHLGREKNQGYYFHWFNWELIIQKAVLYSKYCPQNQQHEQHLRACEKYRLSGPPRPTKNGAANEIPRGSVCTLKFEVGEEVLQSRATLGLRHTWS